MARRILLLLILIKDVTCETAFPSPCIGSGDDDCQSKAHGNYPDCDDCHKFVTCLFDHRVDKSCTVPGTVYDRITGECRHDVSCGGDSLDQVTTAFTTTTSTTGPTASPTTSVTTSPTTSVTTSPSTSVTTSPSTSVTTSPTTSVTTSPTTSVTTSPTTSVTTTLTTVPTTPTTTFSTITQTTVPSSSKTSSASTITTSIISSKSTTTPPQINPIPTSTNATSATTTTTTTTSTFPFSITNFAAQVLRVFDPILPTVTTTTSTTSGTTTSTNQVNPIQNPRLNALPISPLVRAATATPMTTSSQQTIPLTTAEEAGFGRPTTTHSTLTSASAFGNGQTLFGNIASSTSAPNGSPLQGQLTSSKYVKKDGGVHLVKQYRPKVYSSPCLALWDTCLYRSDGYYPSCNTCSTRVICRSGVKDERWCPSGTLYDRYIGRCRPWEFVKCFGI